MSVQDIYFSPVVDLEKGVSAPLALGVGVVFAALLLWATQGTDVIPAGPDWHGNVAPATTVANQ